MASWSIKDAQRRRGKTGTSDSNQDTLFVNYTPEIVVVGWLGNNNNADLN